MNGDPLAHLRGSIRTGEVPGIDGVQGWGICFGDMDDVDTWVFFDDRPEYAGWVMTDVELGDEASTANVIDYLGPEQGEVALRQTQMMRERLAARGAPSEVIERLDAEIIEAQAVLATRIRDAQAAHTAQVTQLAAQLALVDPVDQDIPNVPPALAQQYMTMIVHRDEREWMTFDDEDDENPMIARMDPDQGWVVRYATDPSHQWRTIAVAQVCRAVGPLHAGDVIQESQAQRADLPQDVAERIEREIAAARQDATVWVTQALQAHMRDAQTLERMTRHFPEPGSIDLAP